MPSHWLRRMRNIERATDPPFGGPRVGHGARRKMPAPVLKSRVTVPRLLLLLILASIGLMAIGIPPYRGMALGMVSLSVFAMFGREREDYERVAFMLFAVAGVIALTIL
jgi:hypothetical protein